MDFEELKLEHKEWLTEKFQQDNKQSCELCFANNYLWKSAYPLSVAQVADCALLRYKKEEKIWYAYPIGRGDKKGVIGQILRESNRDKVRISGMTKAEAKELQKWFPDVFEIGYNRDYSDYIYETSRLATLAGKKLHGKRNHINRFKDIPNWTYEPLGKNNAEACMEMLAIWKEKRLDSWDYGAEEEYIVVGEALKEYKELGLRGGVLKIGSQVVAFCIGEPLNQDTFVVHFEKAFAEIQGAYPMINQQFVLHECQSYTYVNREEDAGEEGLRKAKLSYDPAIILDKYYGEEK